MTAKERALMGAGRSLAMAKAAPFIALIPNKSHLYIIDVNGHIEDNIRAGSPKAAIDAYLRKHPDVARSSVRAFGVKGGFKKKNPGRTAEDAYREFHGRDSQEIIEFETTHHFPKRTSAIGDLIELDIKIPRDRHVKGGQYVKLSNFGECWLTENPRMKQLYVEGGDQSLDLAEFGLDESDPHEWEYLGELVRAVYFTTKDHLGKDGGEANYHHKFGKNELTLKKTELIKVGFHVPDEQLWFIGGDYEIPSEGIDG